MKFLSTAVVLCSTSLVRAQDDPLAIYSKHQACDLCGPTDPASLVLPATSTGAPLTCDAARVLAETGRHSTASCMLLRMRTPENCGCEGSKAGEDASPAATTDVNDEVGEKQTTDGTQNLPPGMVKSTSSVLVAPVPNGRLSDTNAAAFEGTMENFISSKITDVSDLECEVANQSVSSSRLVSAVEVIVTCFAKSSMAPNDFQTRTTEILEQDASELVDDLRENPDFIQNVSTIFNFDDTTGDDDIQVDKTKRYVWITAGTFTAGGVMLLCVFIIIFVVNCRTAHQTPQATPPHFTHKIMTVRPIMNTNSTNNKKSTTLSRIPIPAHAAASIAALARESDDPSVQKELASLEDSTLSTGEETASSMMTLRANMSSRMVHAPIGKIGIVIDTTPEGPVVHSVKPTSPVLGQVFPGDMIISVNNEDTRAMSAIALTDLMTRTNDVERELVILSPDVSG